MKHLFRAKRVDNGEMVEGYYYHDQIFKNGNACQDVFYIRDEIDQDFEVLPETVVYIPNEELKQEWLSRLDEYNLLYVNDVKIEELEQCISELKEVSK